MPDHSMLMRTAAEHDISHVRLGQAVAYIEANMDAESSAEAVSLIHAAISPGHAVHRARLASAPIEAEVETGAAEEIEPQSIDLGSDPVAEVADTSETENVEVPKVKTPRAKKAAPAKPVAIENPPAKPTAKKPARKVAPKAK